MWYLTPISDYAVDIMLQQIPIEKDIELGRQAAQALHRPSQTKGDVPTNVYYDAHWTPKLQSIGWHLVESCSFDKNCQKYPWDFGILNDKENAAVVNAYALPGGVVRVTLALLEELQPTTSELAALIGHEMGHVLHRHSQARILQQQLLNYILQAIFYKDDEKEENFGQTVGTLLLQSADWLGQQSFSRANEYEADATSWELLLQSNQYNPKAMESLLSKLWEYHGKQGGTTSWDSTHPGTLDRMHALEQKWEALPYQERQKLTKRKRRN